MTIRPAAGCLLFAMLVPFRIWSAGDEDITVRYALSERLLVGLNPNDARAAFAVWADHIVGTSGLRLKLGNDVVFTRDRLVKSLQAGELDLIGVGLSEFWDFQAYLDGSQFISDPRGGDELVLLVRTDGGIEKLDDLRQRTVQIWQGAGTDLAEPWLYVTMRKAGLPGHSDYLGRVARNPKLSQAVFPVFFGQADACVVTRRGLATMVELNPQVGKRLKVLASSPRLHAGIFVCRRNYPPALRKEVFRRAVSVQKNAGTQQVLTLFQATGYAEFPGTELKPSLAILDEYHRLRALDTAQSR